MAFTKIKASIVAKFVSLTPTNNVNYATARFIAEELYSGAVLTTELLMATNMIVNVDVRDKAVYQSVSSLQPGNLVLLHVGLGVQPAHENYPAKLDFVLHQVQVKKELAKV